MTEIEITRLVYFISISITAILSNVVIWFQSKRLRQYKSCLSDTFEELKRVYESNDLTMRYCLKHIMKKSIDEQDFETAEKCKKWVEEIESRIPKFKK